MRRVALALVLAILAILAIACAGAAVSNAPPSHHCPGAPDSKLQEAIDRAFRSARPHASHVWRDTPAQCPDGSVHVVVEIARGSLDKREFDLGANALRLDRKLDSSLGGYPVNYGFVPRTMAWDGDPLDALLLGGPRSPGTLAAGQIVAVMWMDDEKGRDPKVVVRPVDGAADFAARDRERIGGWFDRYKETEEGKWSGVSGWGDAGEGWVLLEEAQALFMRGAGLDFEGGGRGGRGIRSGRGGPDGRDARVRVGSVTERSHVDEAGEL